MMGWTLVGLLAVAHGLRAPSAAAPRRRKAPLRSVATENAVKTAILLPPHPKFVRGKLKNGLEYAILPNAAPAGRFEAHLEVFAGSADERAEQQGMAHLVEHVAYMGSRKRERLFGTGSQTNAYTDFHHTVFYACCPVEAPKQEGGGAALESFFGGGRGGAGMLPRALDALAEVLCAEFQPSRVEKERQAVLSEMSMVNTIEYRVECQVLRALHSENALARRFPIGLEDQIKSWTVDDVKKYHGEHYRPDNALLYIVGDVDPNDVVPCIEKIFGGLGVGYKQLDTLQLSDEALKRLSLKAQSRHFPPIVHTWSGGPLDARCDVPGFERALRDVKDLDFYEKLLPLDVAPTVHHETGLPVRVHLFQHPLLQSFSFHLFAKRPVEPVVTLEDHRVYVMRRITLAALQVRLNVLARDEPVFSFVEFNYLDSAREACAVVSLDMTADASRWEDAVKAAVRETRRLGLFGLTPSELERFGDALATDSEQLATMGDQLAHGEQLTHLMETLACAHTFISPETAHAATLQALDTITLEEANAVARDLCAHVIDFGSTALPSAMVACAPTMLSDRTTPVVIDNAKLLRVASEAASEPLEPEPELLVPKALVTPDQVAELVADRKPVWKSAERSQATGVFSAVAGNGLRVNVRPLPSEAQRGHLRITAAGGRSSEKQLGAVALGARTLQEGGAFSPWSREQVELFCVDRLIMVEVAATDDAVFIDFQFPTPVPRTGGCSGVEAALQIAHKILDPGAFVWETDAFDRARPLLQQQYDTTLRAMEGAAQDALLSELLQDDARFLSLKQADGHLDRLDLETVQTAVMRQLRASNVEVSIVGDFDALEVEALSLKYLGSVAVDPAEDADAADAAPEAVPLAPEGKKWETLRVHVPDSDLRAAAYVAGSAPNRFGVLADGRSVAEALGQGGKLPARWQKPGFGAVVLALLQEVINRRLFSVVRERKQLTYDANFHFCDHERLCGGWYVVSVTASVDKAQRALDACVETLTTLKTSAPVTRDNLESARRVVANRHLAELHSNKYWCEQLAGVSFASMPGKGVAGLADYAGLAEQATLGDLKAVLDLIDVDSMHTCIATSGDADSQQPNKVEQEADEHGNRHVSGGGGARRR
ncbi:hypothetical protein M885DRAFT_526193 [Pelagophyceae sp. CCMP2097]|nr:hypothetical protein M885DRAFT_526193 [Pelagophyceae sp. CCMP2097]